MMIYLEVFGLIVMVVLLIDAIRPLCLTWMWYLYVDSKTPGYHVDPDLFHKNWRYYLRLNP